ncbi:hypothetical protein TRVA0_018S00320 [Trichomonascus vanleenenianus]|uniref:uncharacterized protein n=1 Tax=Trichomonascus vanleenenianus TaxID=2268995 RepID=UPI003EC96708
MSTDHRRHRRVLSFSRRKSQLRIEEVLSKFLALEQSEASFTTAYLVTKQALESESIGDKLKYCKTAQYLYESGINNCFALKQSSYYNSALFSIGDNVPLSPGHDYFPDASHAGASSPTTVGTSILLEKHLPALPVEVVVVASPDSAGGFKPYSSPEPQPSGQSNLNPQPTPPVRIKSSNGPMSLDLTDSTMVDPDGPIIGTSLPNLDDNGSKTLLPKRNSSIDSIDIRKVNQHIESTRRETEYLRRLSNEAGVTGLAITYEGLSHPPQILPPPPPPPPHHHNYHYPPPPSQQMSADPLNDSRPFYGDEDRGRGGQAPEEFHSASSRTLSSSTFSSVFSDRPPIISPRVDSKPPYVSRLRSDLSSPYLTSPEMAPGQQHSSPNRHSDPLSMEGESKSYCSENAELVRMRLSKKLNTIAELVNTEELFARDMTVVLYVFLKKLLHEPFFGYVCKQDITILASNIEEIVQLSSKFIDDLKAAIPEVVLDPHRDLASMSLDEQEALLALKTNIGEAILNYLPKMENAFTIYCNNNSQQMATYNRIDKLACPAIARWKAESKEESFHMTKASTMDMLIVKPVQRLLKYPLFLGRLLSNMSEDNPEHESLRLAAEQVQLCTDRINSASHEDFTTATMDTFPNVALARLNTQMEGLITDLHADFVLEELLSVFDDKKSHVKDLIRSIQANTVQIERHFDNNGRLAKSWLSWVMATGDMPPPLRPESEGSLQDLQKKTSRMKRYKHYTLFASPFTSSSSNQVSTSHLTQTIERDVLEPLESVWDTYRRTETVIRDRQKCHSSFVRYVKSTTRGSSGTHVSGSPDSQTKNEADLFIKYHNSLKDGLPELFNLSGEVVELCMRRFVSIQQEWFRMAADSLANVFQIKVDDIKDLSGDDKDPVLNRFRKTYGARYYNLDALSIIQGTEIEEDRKPLLFEDPRSGLEGDYDRSSSPSKRSSHSKLPSSASTPALAYDALHDNSPAPQSSKKSAKSSLSAASDREKGIKSKPSLLSLSAWQRSASPKKK